MLFRLLVHWLRFEIRASDLGGAGRRTLQVITPEGTSRAVEDGVASLVADCLPPTKEVPAFKQQKLRLFHLSRRHLVIEIVGKTSDIVARVGKHVSEVFGNRPVSQASLCCWRICTT